jgi:FkbH-like protein
MEKVNLVKEILESKLSQENKLWDIANVIGNNPSILEIININNEIDSFTFENKSLKGCLISNMTVKELKHPLKYFSRLNQIDLNFHYEEPYQEQMVLIDKNSILNKNSWDFIFLFYDYSKLFQTTPVFPDDDKHKIIIKRIKSIFKLLKNFSINKPCKIFMNNFIDTNIPLSKLYSDKTEFGLDKLSKIINDFIDEYSSENNNFETLDIVNIMKDIGRESFVDIQKYWNKDSLFTPKGYNYIAKNLSERLRSSFIIKKKVLALDMDNTLWNGVVGEDGINNINYLPDNFKGKIFNNVLNYYKYLSNTGVLLIGLSKNNYKDVIEVLEKEDFPLGKDDFSGLKINWKPKYINLVELISELNLGIDSVVFIDDSDIECKQMRELCPEVVTLKVPDILSDYPFMLSRMPFFNRTSLSKSDLIRKKDYINIKKRIEYKSDFSDLDQFIKGLEIKIKAILINNDFDRVSQLFNRTNQFTLSAIRYQPHELKNKIKAGYKIFAIDYLDQFGHAGIIGAILFKKNKEDIYIDSFSLSCRVLGRNVEYAIFSNFFDQSSIENTKFLVVNYIKTSRNRPIKIFLDKLKMQNQRINLIDIPKQKNMSFQIDSKDIN